jgi:hypothetical protein
MRETLTSRRRPRLGNRERRDRMSAEETFQNLKRSGFLVEDKRPERDYHVVTCKTCKARWSMSVKQAEGGAILTLLDHQIGHERHA